MDQKTLQELFTYFKKKRGNKDDSDCAIVNKVWRIYWTSSEKDVRCKALSWLLERMLDSSTSSLARKNIYVCFYHNRHSLPKKHVEMYRVAVGSLPKRKRKKLKKARKE